MQETKNWIEETISYLDKLKNDESVQLQGALLMLLFLKHLRDQELLESSKESVIKKIFEFLSASSVLQLKNKLDTLEALSKVFAKYVYSK